jgi:hypothetical protein
LVLVTVRRELVAGEREAELDRRTQVGRRESLGRAQRKRQMRRLVAANETLRPKEWGNTESRGQSDEEEKEKKKMRTSSLDVKEGSNERC